MIDFKTTMDEKSVEKALSIMPDEPMNFFWSTSASLHKLRVVFPNALSPNTKYTITIDTTAYRSDSQRVPAPLQISFTTTAFRVDYYYPPDRGEKIPVDRSLEYQFNIPVDSVSFLEAFSITPSMDSIGITFVSGGRTVIVNHTPFVPLQTYSVIIDTNLSTLKGNCLSKPIRHSFTTRSFAETVEKIIPPDTLTPFSTDDSITLKFPVPMSPVSFEGRVRIQPDIPFIMVWNVPKAMQCTLIPLQTWRAGTLYTVTIDSGYTAAGGETGEKYSFTFSTVPLNVISFSPFNGQINVSLETPIRFTFNTAIDTFELLSNIIFEPQIDQPELESDTAFPQEIFTIKHASFLPETVYTVTLKKNINDLYGATMERDFVCSFRTRK